MSCARTAECAARGSTPAIDIPAARTPGRPVATLATRGNREARAAQRGSRPSE